MLIRRGTLFLSAALWSTLPLIASAAPGGGAGGPGGGRAGGGGGPRPSFAQSAAGGTASGGGMNRAAGSTQTGAGGGQCNAGGTGTGTATGTDTGTGTGTGTSTQTTGGNVGRTTGGLVYPQSSSTSTPNANVPRPYQPFIGLLSSLTDTNLTVATNTGATSFSLTAGATIKVLSHGKDIGLAGLTVGDTVGVKADPKGTVISVFKLPTRNAAATALSPTTGNSLPAGQ